MESLYTTGEGNPLFYIDYIDKETWGIFDDFYINVSKPLFSSKSVRELVSKVAKIKGDPQVEMSDCAEFAFCIEVSGGTKTWIDGFFEEDDEEENYC